MLGNPVEAKTIEVKRKKSKTKLVGNQISFSPFGLQIDFLQTRKVKPDSKSPEDEKDMPTITVAEPEQLLTEKVNKQQP